MLGLSFAAKSGFKVVAISSSASKKDAALQHGASVFVDSSKENPVDVLNKLGGAKVVLCTAPNASTVGGLVGGMAVDGTIVVLAVLQDKVCLETLPMILKRINVRGWPAGVPSDSEETVKFGVEAGVSIPVEKFTLDQAQQAFEKMENGSVRFRSVIVPL